jgi:hypothetical protein
MSPLPVGDRSRRLLATRPQWRREPWGSNFVTAALLSYALGLTDEPVTDEAFARAYRAAHPSRSDFPTEARYTPLGLARVLALRREGRDEEADALLHGATITQAAPLDPTPEPAGEPEPVVTAEVTVEVVPEAPVEESAPSTVTPIPEGFPERERLEEASVTTLEQIEAMTDADLLALPGVGRARVSLIRAAVMRERG